MISGIKLRLNIVMLQCYDFILTWNFFEYTFKVKYLRKESLNN